MDKLKGRDIFLKELQDAASSSRFPNITDLASGDDHSSFSFAYTSSDRLIAPVTIQAMVVADISDYPKSHSFFLYTDSEKVPPAFSEALESIRNDLDGVSLSKMLSKVADCLSSNQAGELQYDADTEVKSGNFEDLFQDEDEDNDIPMSDGESLIEEKDDDGGDEDLIYEEDEDENEYLDYWSPQSPEDQSFGLSSGAKPTCAEQSLTSKLKAILRRDLGTAHKAGFKVGVLGDLLSGGSKSFLTISIRVSKLGISEEALQAWNVDRNQYLVLIISYPKGYCDMGKISVDLPKYDKSRVEMRVGLCQSYKPSLSSAALAFTTTTKVGRPPKLAASSKAQTLTEEDKLQSMFLSPSLRGLLNDRLFSILGYRLKFGFDWGGAELFYNENQCKITERHEKIDSKYYTTDDTSAKLAFPQIVTDDHFARSMANASFPLTCMQFVLRHFVRCTEFCLICHCNINANFEALKPYVCDKPLCLYQYMSLGFGPSIEWEIMSQPYVVDLLVSFCYEGAVARRLKNFPSGLHLQIPPSHLKKSSSHVNYVVLPNQFPTVEENLIPKVSLKATYKRTANELIFNHPHECPLRGGDWIVIHQTDSLEIHCRVMDCALYPTVKLGNPITRTQSQSVDQFDGRLDSKTNIQTLTSTPLEQEVSLNKYDLIFDELNAPTKMASICLILDTLPDVIQMKNYLIGQQGHKAEPSLGDWNDRISVPALNLLRWIVASNRSCLIQVDDMRPSSETPKHATIANKEERVHGMGTYMQFRFAQGSPDKEQRFVNAVQTTTTRLGLQFPTLFAWHGSGLYNWHGIIREGLHFNDTINGRAYGHGVYLSNHLETSLSYCHSGTQRDGIKWQQSKLGITGAIALVEVVNAPAEYISASPHYVVNKLDWIQTRYLFVQCTADGKRSFSNERPKVAYVQDPVREVRSGRESIVIPITAISKARRPASTPRPSATGGKRVKVEVDVTAEEAQRDEDERNSIASHPSDVEWFRDTEDDADLQQISAYEFNKTTANSNFKMNLTQMTDFVENALDIATLPMLAAPSYATPTATRALQRALRETLTVQNSTPLHELGWYTNPEHITNMYQWIVELHSFDPDLLLAKDMKIANVKSIVCELRFTSNYPFSPPFVRVIRPRFLPFQQGGGGHVTAGGAMCMELLTSTGWSAVNNIESVLLQVRMAISSTDPKPARLEAAASRNRFLSRDYAVGEAVEAYVRACQMHGWKVPEGFTNFTQESPKLPGGNGSTAQGHGGGYI